MSKTSGKLMSAVARALFRASVFTNFLIISVSLNDLTIENLKQRAKEVESQLNECRSKISEKQTSIIQQETELQTVKFKTDPSSITR